MLGGSADLENNLVVSSNSLVGVAGVVASEGDPLGHGRPAPARARGLLVVRRLAGVHHAPRLRRGDTERHCHLRPLRAEGGGAPLG